jgi:hypothetical protein
MTAIYHPGVVTIIAKYNLGQVNPAVNVTHWRSPVTPQTAGTLVAIRDAFNTAWSTGWKSAASASNSYLGCTVVDASSLTGGQAESGGYTPVSGLISGGSMSDQVCGLISMKGVNRYRGGHSRLYIPSVPITLVNSDNRTITPALILAYDTLMTGVRAAMLGLSGVNGGPLNQVIWHKKWAAAPNTIEDVFNWTSQPVLATQRRRIRKVSRHKARGVVA